MSNHETSSTMRPATLGHWYDVIERVGSGMAAVVYRVRDRRDGVIKAAKVLRGEMAVSEETVRRFENEYRILHGLHHPSLPEVSDYGWGRDASRYMVMELVEGERLDAYLQAHPEDLWEILYQLCEVLTFIHAHDLLHQDFKPGNVLVRRTSAYGETMPLVTLIDFGLTYRRGVGTSSAMVGTLEYMAPEVIRGEAALTRAVDYYSLGVTLYQLVQGRLPFVGDARAVTKGHLRDEVVIHEERIEHAEIYPHIRGLMAKDVRDRLEAFESFRRAVVGRMTGGIEELEKAYGLARINSLGMVGKEDVRARVEEWLRSLSEEPSPGIAGTEDRASIGNVLVLAGHPTSGRSYLERWIADAARVSGMSVLNASAKRELEAFVERGRGDLTRAWSLLTEDAAGPSIVIVDARGKLSDAEWDFLGFLQARALAQTGSEGSFGLVVLGPGTDGETLPFDMALFDVHREVVPHPSEEDRSRLWEDMRPWLLSTQETDLLRAALLESSGTAGALVGMLRNAIQRDALLFRGGRFVCTTDVGASFDVEGGSEPYAPLVESLPSRERDVVFALACHLEPVPVGLLADVLQVSADAIEATIERATRLMVLHRTPRGVEIAGDALREAAYGMIPGETRRRLHRRFVSMFERNVAEAPTIATAAALCHHYGLLGDIRAAFLCHAPVVRRLRHDLPDETLRMECRRGLDLCNRVDDAGGKFNTRQLRRFYAKLWVAHESGAGRRNRVRSIVEEYYVERSLPIPAGLVELYSLALMRARRQDTTMVDEALQTVAYPRSEVALALQLERARILENVGSSVESLRVLDDVERGLSKLGPRHASRLFLYRMMNYVKLGDEHPRTDVVVRGESIAVKNKLWDECVAFRHMRVSALYQKGQFAEAVRVLRDALRLAHRHGLAFRLAQLYFMASAIYFAAGSYVRSLRYLGRAVRIAEGMGETASVSVYVSRYVMIYQCLGLLGNATRYAMRAVRIHDEGSTLDEAIAAHSALCETLVLMHSRASDGAMRNLERRIHGDVRTTRMSHYLMARGDFLMEKERYSEATESYARARVMNERAGIDDDAFQALVREVHASLKIRDGFPRDKLRHLLEAAPVSTMSAPLQGEYRAVWVLLTREVGTVEEIKEACELGEKTRNQLDNVIVGKDLDRVLIDGWLHVGDVERAKLAFNRYYSAFKMMLSNLDPPAVDEFCKGEGIDELISRYRAI